MKPLHHYLRRFCSEQVQILLQRMEDHYAEEFAVPDSKWEAYVESDGRAFDRYTKLEAFCVTCTRDAQEKIYKRQQMLNGILVCAMSPAKTKYAFNREQERERGEAAGPTKMVVSRAQYELMQKLANQAAAQPTQHQQHVELHNKLTNWLSRP